MKIVLLILFTIIALLAQSDTVQKSEEPTIEELKQKLATQDKIIKENYKLIQAYRQKFFVCDNELTIRKLDEK